MLTTDQMIHFRNDLLEHGTARLPGHTASMDMRYIFKLLTLNRIEFEHRLIGDWYVFTKKTRGAQENCD